MADLNAIGTSCGRFNIDSVVAAIKYQECGGIFGILRMLEISSGDMTTGREENAIALRYL